MKITAHIALVLLLCACEQEATAIVETADGVTGQELECWGWCRLWDIETAGELFIDRPQPRPR